MADPVTIGVLASAALGLAGEAIARGEVSKAVIDCYRALKDKIAVWAGPDVEALEKKPTSKLRQAVVAEIIDTHTAHDRVVVLTLAERLIAVLKTTSAHGLDVGRLEALDIRIGAIEAKGATGIRIKKVDAGGDIIVGNIIVDSYNRIPENISKSKAAEVTATEVPSGASSLVPATERQINVWIGDGEDEGPKPAPKIGQTCRLNFRVGRPVIHSLTSGTNAVVQDVPKGGLRTDWLVIAQGASLRAVTDDIQVVQAEGGVPTWKGLFKLTIPEEGDSQRLQLDLTPLQSAPTIDVIISAHNERTRPDFSEIYRQFKVELSAADGPAGAAAEATRITNDFMPTATAHVGLRTTHEWTTPTSVLNLTVFGSHAAVQGWAGAQQIDAVELWEGIPGKVSGRIDRLREQAEEMRAAWETHFNDIDPIDLADRLKRWANREGGPEYNWSSLGNYADAVHREYWDKMAVSAELRRLAQQGRQLFQAFFPRASNLYKWIIALAPGARLNIFWTPKSGAGFISHVPWGLMYTADVPPEGQPVDPMGFLGLRCRIAYTSHAMAPASRALGARNATHRAHFLYWGDAPTDVTGQEARWQRRQWGAWENQIFVPKTAQVSKTELLTLLNDPQPSPTSILYIFCQCNIGSGNNPILRFGSTNDPANVITQFDFGTASLADRPLVFVNACTTVAADPYMSNDLEESFFERDCRAFIGTETKVPIVLASRFAEIFFQFFYRLLDEAPMAAGEAVSQTRLFLWTHYRNIGGLFYTCVNQYDLFVAREDEVLALRG
jgi:hypothetical protein